MSHALPPDASPYCAFATPDLITPPPPLRLLAPVTAAVSSFVWGAWAPRSPAPPPPAIPGPPDLAAAHREPILVPDLTPQNPTAWSPPPPIKVTSRLPALAVHDARVSDAVMRHVPLASLPAAVLLTLGADEGRGCLPWRVRHARRLIANPHGTLVFRLASVAFVEPLVRAWIPTRPHLVLRVKKDLWEEALLAARVILASDAAADDIAEEVLETLVTFCTLYLEIE
jgi:hypothetical protein